MYFIVFSFFLAGGVGSFINTPLYWTDGTENSCILNKGNAEDGESLSFQTGKFSFLLEEGDWIGVSAISNSYPFSQPRSNLCLPLDGGIYHTLQSSLLSAPRAGQQQARDDVGILDLVEDKTLWNLKTIWNFDLLPFVFYVKKTRSLPEQIDYQLHDTDFQESPYCQYSTTQFPPALQSPLYKVISTLTAWTHSLEVGGIDLVPVN